MSRGQVLNLSSPQGRSPPMEAGAATGQQQWRRATPTGLCDSRSMPFWHTVVPQCGSSAVPSPKGPEQQQGKCWCRQAPVATQRPRDHARAITESLSSPPNEPALESLWRVTRRGTEGSRASDRNEPGATRSNKATRWRRDVDTPRWRRSAHVVAQGRPMATCSVT